MSAQQKILIVDDSPTNLALLQHMLRDMDCQVIKALNGGEAVALTREHDFALILLDIQMPGMDGYETASRIKEHGRGQHVPIIFITAFYRDDLNVRRGYENGAIDYLFRPVDMSVLTHKVRVFLQLDEQKLLLEREVEQRRRAEAALRVAEEKYRSIFERAVEGIFQCTVEGEFLEANPAMLRVLGYDSVSQVLHRPGLRFTIMSEDPERELYRERMEQEGGVCRFEYHLRRRDGEVIWCCESSHVVSPESGAPFVEGVLVDVTERKRCELELKRLATVDSLTGIANRHRFFDRLEHALLVAKRYDSRLALLFVDLNDFKLVNDTYGHNTGDLLLRRVAERLQKRLRESDTLGRIGGDEFCVLLSNIPDDESARSVAEILLSVLHEPFQVDGRELRVGATVGISFFPGDGRDSVSLISRADAAMYGAKKKGLGCGVFAHCGAGAADAR